MCRSTLNTRRRVTSFPLDFLARRFFRLAVAEQQVELQVDLRPAVRPLFVHLPELCCTARWLASYQGTIWTAAIACMQWISPDRMAEGLEAADARPRNVLQNSVFFSRGTAAEDGLVLQFLDTRTLVTMRRCSIACKLLVAGLDMRRLGGTARLVFAHNISKFSRCFPKIRSFHARFVKSGEDLTALADCSVKSLLLVTAWPPAAISAEHFAGLRSLRQLSLPSYAHIPVGAFAHLCQLESLELLRTTGLTDEMFQPLVHLKSLSLSMVTDLSPSNDFLGYLPALTSFTASDMVLSVSGLRAIADKVEHLDLSRCGIRGPTADITFAPMTRLHTLKLAFCGGIPGSAFLDFPPSVRELVLMYPSADMSNACFEHFGRVRTFRYWQTVMKAGEPDAVTWHAFANLRSVEHLEVEGPPLNEKGPISKCSMNDDSLAPLEHLTHLTLNNCVNVGDGALLAMGHRLHHLAVSGAHSVSNAGLAACVNLRSLSLVGLVDSEFTAGGILRLLPQAGYGGQLQQLTLPDSQLLDDCRSCMILEPIAGSSATACVHTLHVRGIAADGAGMPPIPIPPLPRPQQQRPDIPVLTGIPEGAEGTVWDSHAL